MSPYEATRQALEWLFLVHLSVDTKVHASRKEAWLTAGGTDSVYNELKQY